MGHELYRAVASGEYQAAYYKRPAWHKLGTVIADDQPAPTSGEMLTASGLHVKVNKQRLLLDPKDENYNGSWNPEHTRVADNFALVRADSGETLSVVGNDYEVIQNWEAFEFLDSLMQDGIMRYECAFALKNMRQVVIVARMPSVDYTTPDDKSLRYVHLSLSHGFGTVKMFGCSFRAECANMYALAELMAARDAAIGKLGGLMTVRHSGNVAAKLNQARLYFSQLDKQFTLYCEQTKALLTGATPERVEEYLERLFPAPKELDGSKRKGTVWKEKLEQVGKYFAAPAQTLPGMRGTWWQAFNAVTAYIDHGTPARQSRGQRDRDENRYVNSLTGPGADKKAEAMKLALEYANAGTLAA